MWSLDRIKQDVESGSLSNVLNIIVEPGFGGSEVIKNIAPIVPQNIEELLFIYLAMSSGYNEDQLVAYTKDGTPEDFRRKYAEARAIIQENRLVEIPVNIVLSAIKGEQAYGQMNDGDEARQSERDGETASVAEIHSKISGEFTSFFNRFGSGEFEGRSMAPEDSLELIGIFLCVSAGHSPSEIVQEFGLNGLGEISEKCAEGLVVLRSYDDLRHAVVSTAARELNIPQSKLHL